MLLALSRVWHTVALLLALAEPGPRQGFGAVALLFGDIYAEILPSNFALPTSLELLSTASACNILASSLHAS